MKSFLTDLDKSANSFLYMRIIIVKTVVAIISAIKVFKQITLIQITKISRYDVTSFSN